MIWILTAVLGFLLIAGLGFAFVGNGNESSAKAIKRAQLVAGNRQNGARIKVKAASDPGARRKQIIADLKDADRRQRKAKVSLSARLRQAGLGASVKTFWLISAGIGVFVFLATTVVGQNPLIGLAAAAGFGLGLPRWVLGFLAKKREKKFTAEFSNALDIIVRGIKSGLPVHDCLKIIARESPEPLGGEFRLLVENLGMGMSIEQALEKAYERMPTSELRFFTIVLNIQQKSGGNLAEALGGLSTVIRARKMMREKIKAMSGEATASAGIIGALPPGVMAMVTMTTPSYMLPLFTDDRGKMMLLGSALWMAMGVFVMKKMINFKV